MPLPVLSVVCDLAVTSMILVEFSQYKIPVAAYVGLEGPCDANSHLTTRRNRGVVASRLPPVRHTPLILRPKPPDRSAQQTDLLHGREIGLIFFQ